MVGKPGLDGHDRGAKIVARALRDAGHEVIYTGLHQTPEQIVETAIQEDADLIGLSVLSGAHMTLFRRLVELLAERDASDIVVFGGGIIPEEDIPVLEEIGVAKVFTPGATTGEITGWVAEHFGDGHRLEVSRPRSNGQRPTSRMSRTCWPSGARRAGQPLRGDPAGGTARPPPGTPGRQPSCTSSRWPASSNWPTRSPPPTSQTSRSPAAVTRSAYAGATSP